MENIECLGVTFLRNFDSANLGKVEAVPYNISAANSESSTSTNSKIPSDYQTVNYEFNIWTIPDCYGTEFENGNRTWFYFGIRANSPSLILKLNIVDLNKQAKMYSQGMCPVYKVVPSRNGWDRIRDKPTYTNDDEIFTLSFKYRTPDNGQAITYFAFTYPFSYLDLQKMLANIDTKVASMSFVENDDIYYVRECVCRSLDNRRIDLLTLTSKKGMSQAREVRLKNLFPEENVPRPHKFPNKKVIFISARVHPGETPSSFVFNGLLHMLLNRDDQIAIHLRRMYVFKLIPFLNPDGVSRGHYRTDSRGVNLNRMYLNPSITLHPSIYAARALIRYYHYGCERPDTITLCPSCVDGSSIEPSSSDQIDCQSGNMISSKVSNMSLEESDDGTLCLKLKRLCTLCGSPLKNSSSDESVDKSEELDTTKESGLFLYMDMHGHASKKGIFIYGNHFDTADQNVECMLLPKLMSINNHNFHFTACNFSERNMFVKDKRDGMSRAGSGRVAISALTGLIKSYTLECNYNTGRIVNVIPPTIKERQQKAYSLPTPPKYSPQVFEEVGRSLGVSILDLTGNNPLSRLPQSEFHSLNGVTEWLRNNYLQNFNESGQPNNLKSKTRTSLTQGAKRRSRVRSTPSNPSNANKNALKIRPSSVPIERKENVSFDNESLKIQPSCSTKIPKRKSTAIRIHKTSLKKSKSKVALSLKCKNVNEKGKIKPKSVIVGRKMEITTKFHSDKTENAKSKIVKMDDSGKFQSKSMFTWTTMDFGEKMFDSDGKSSFSAPSEPCSSGSQSGFRGFSKNSVFGKKKHLLRRIGGNGEGVNKTEKLKKKKRLVKKL